MLLGRPGVWAAEEAAVAAASAAVDLPDRSADLCAEVGTGGNCVPVRGGTAPGRCEDGGAGLLSGAHAVRLGRLVRLVIDVLVYESSVSILSMSIDSCPFSSSSSTRIGTE